MILSPATRARLPERAIYVFSYNQYYYELSQQPRISAQTVAYSAEAGQQVSLIPLPNFRGSLSDSCCAFISAFQYIYAVNRQTKPNSCEG